MAVLAVVMVHQTATVVGQVAMVPMVMEVVVMVPVAMVVPVAMEVCNNQLHCQFLYIVIDVRLFAWQTNKLSALFHFSVCM